MKLKLLSIEGNKEYERINGIKPIRIRTYHITSIFMYFFSNIDLDGSSKLIIHFYEAPENEGRYVCDKYFHVSTYNIDKDMLKKGYLLEEQDFNEFFLQIIVEVCKYIAEVNNKSEELMEKIEQAADNVRLSNFELTLLQKKLSKLSTNKIYKANVYRIINYLGERWYVEMENKRKGTIERYEMMEKYDHISKVDFFRKSYWKDETFIITDKFDREVGRFEMKASTEPVR